MNEAILQPDVQAFINHNLHMDIPTLLFQKSPFASVSSKALAEQIASKRKSEKKLPSWFALKKGYFPNKLNISQTSSEITGAYKASLVQGSFLADLTGGFGVDTHAFSKVVSHIVHVETNPSLSKIAQYNLSEMGVSNIDFRIGDGIEFLRDSEVPLDWLYLDPSRRTATHKKVFYLADCEPDITQHLDLFFSKAKNILLKTGPLLDLSVGLEQLRHVKEIHIVAVGNDVKEVLWVLANGFTAEPLVHAVTITHNETTSFQFLASEEKAAIPICSDAQSYLYEPNPALLKSGAFKLISERLQVHKLHQHSHLYTSETHVDFPGRHFKIIAAFNYNPREVKKLGLAQANITVRNFPYSVATIRKKLKLKDGGDDYLFFTRNHLDKLMVVHCRKI